MAKLSCVLYIFNKINLEYLKVIKNNTSAYFLYISLYLSHTLSLSLSLSHSNTTHNTHTLSLESEKIIEQFLLDRDKKNRLLLFVKKQKSRVEIVKIRQWWKHNYFPFAFYAYMYVLIFFFSFFFYSLVFLMVSGSNNRYR